MLTIILIPWSSSLLHGWDEELFVVVFFVKARGIIVLRSLLLPYLLHDMIKCFFPRIPNPNLKFILSSYRGGAKQRNPPSEKMGVTVFSVC